MKSLNNELNPKIFELKSEQDIKDIKVEVNLKEDLNLSGEKEDLQLSGARAAAIAVCDINILKMYFSRIYQKAKEEINNLSDNQKRKIRELENKITGLKSHNETIQVDIDGQKEQINDKNERIDKLREEKGKKIEKVNSDIELIREEINKISTGDKSLLDDELKESDRIGFWLGSTILLFLSIYLFIFYTSVIYSAFIFDVSNFVIKGLKAKEILTATIVNLEAIPNTYAEHGLLGDVFLFSAAFLFIALGYLIYKFEHSKSIEKSLLIYSFTFFFDALLAYTIVRDIYEAKFQAGQIFNPWQFVYAFSDTNFYIILMAGFSIYIIWGLILSYVIKEYDNLAPKTNAIRNRRARIKQLLELKNNTEIKFEEERDELRKEIDTINLNISELRKKIENNKTAIDSLIDNLEHIQQTIEIPIAEVKRRVTEFTVGWANQIALLFPDEMTPRVDQCRAEKEKFLNQVSPTTL